MPETLASIPAQSESHARQCRPWCTVASDPDPFHVSEYSAVDLSLTGDTLLARLEKGCTSPDTYVAIVHKDRYDLDLTLAEADELAGTLAALVLEARAAEAALVLRLAVPGSLAVAEASQR